VDRYYDMIVIVDLLRAVALILPFCDLTPLTLLILNFEDANNIMNDTHAAGP
jgi:hypothetical protein